MFVSQDKHEVKAHRLVLSLSCSFFKDLFNALAGTEVYKIVLPNFSTESVQAFVQFFYAGEILITDNVAAEFASLCHEFNMSEIPVIKTLIKNHKLKEALDEPTVSITISQIEVPKMEDTTFDDYFQTNEHVETIFFNENDPEFPSDRDGDIKKTEESIKDEQYLNVQFIDDNPNFEMIEEADKAESNEGSIDQKDEIPQTPEFLENLEMAAEEVRKGMSFWNAHRRYGVARGMILKHLQKKSEIQQAKRKLKKALAVTSAPTLPQPAVPINIAQLRAEQDMFKKRLQEAINSCRDAGNSPQKAARMFKVPVEAIERSLRGFRKTVNV